MQTYWQYFLVFLVVLRESASQKCVLKYENGTEINDDGFGITLTAIEDVKESGTVLINIHTESVQSIINIDRDPKNEYVSVDDSAKPVYTLKVSDLFADYEKQETQTRIRMTIEFQCTTGTRKLEIWQDIIDTNNHDPEFINAPYSYSLPMPFPKNFSIDLLGEISAKDIDLTNKMISFALTEEDPLNGALAISHLAVDTTDLKKHFARLTTKAVLTLESDVTFTIKAIDSGEPQRSSTTTVTIKIDKASEILKFSQPVYTTDCSDLHPEEADGFILEFNEGKIGVSGTTGSELVYSIKEKSGKYDKNFAFAPSEDLTTLEISIKDPPTSFFKETFVVLTLTGRRSGSEANTVVHISLPGPEKVQKPSETCPEEEYCTDCSPIIITLSVLLVLVSAGLIVPIVLLWRRLKSSRDLEKANRVVEQRGEMQEIERKESDPSSNGLPRRSVAFNDTVEEIKVARL